jgi:1-acyl-sn-glycerol-3-phosphate acyltransferase
MLSDSGTNVLAACVLACAGSLLVAWSAVRLRHLGYSFAQTPFFAWNLLMTRVVWRAEIVGSIPVEPGQGAVFVCNHRGSLDPSFVALAAGRLVHWMIAKEYWASPLLGWFFRTVEAIPVGRGGVDTAATKLAIRYAREGGWVGLFPEGRINTTDQLMLPGRPGVALIALKARVPVIPCYISGSPYDGTPMGCLLMTAKTRLVVGKAIDLSEYFDRENGKETLEELTRRFLIEIARLAGVENYQPRLAGPRWNLKDGEG